MKGNKLVKILEVGHSIEAVPEQDKNPNSKLKELTDKRDKKNEEIQINRQEHARLTQLKEFVKKFADKALDRVDQQPPKTVDEARQIMDYYGSEWSRLAPELLKLEKENKKLREELAAIEVELNKINAPLRNQLPGDSNMSADNYMMIAHVKVLRTCEVGTALPDITLTYMVEKSKASWQPSYDIRISSEKRTMLVTYYAEVKQNSGESWDDVDLLLSTANPSVGSTPKRLPKIIAREYRVNNYNKMGYNLKAGMKMKKGSKGGGGGPHAPHANASEKHGRD